MSGPESLPCSEPYQGEQADLPVFNVFSLRDLPGSAYRLLSRDAPWKGAAEGLGPVFDNRAR